MTPRRVQTVGYLVWHLSPKWRIAVDRALRQFGLTRVDSSVDDLTTILVRLVRRRAWLRSNRKVYDAGRSLG